ncbi:tryptophanase leader peptide [Morganella morganii]|nr:tryptophanase leader peptide [Morganella morganii]ELW9227065.1 tryptophanase leader peptide [Morganella morganii]
MRLSHSACSAFFLRKWFNIDSELSFFFPN